MCVHVWVSGYGSYLCPPDQLKQIGGDQHLHARTRTRGERKNFCSLIYRTSFRHTDAAQIDTGSTQYLFRTMRGPLSADMLMYLQPRAGSTLPRVPPCHPKLIPFLSPVSVLLGGN